MSSSRKARWAAAGGVISIVLATSVLAQTVEGGRFGFGRVATPQEIAGWDIDVRPDGHGVRKGKGDARRGQEI